ncbi:hypothetical protein MAPG_10257 [Magnaporthiopsis poae ATCC 64411]|uniref:Heterokaryon incompatibility domain-containing protein n=1 Tax=Magnaporthiopsis poae (strain ATCC 64411 / 73-15) TaxID=644358 RepID=A0A0C4EC43_MAGP6|nr:hypothetical protein MAPG_10257 [Magnaporthiopsis poae ATCC 64411]
MSSSALIGSRPPVKAECEVCCGIGALLISATVGELAEGEDAGCSLCEILRRAINTHTPGRPPDEPISLCHGLGIYEMVVGGYADNRIKISVYGHDRPGAEMRSVYEAGLYEETPADAVVDIIGNTSSPAAMSKIRGWIENCRENHKGCRLATPQPLPTRVLDPLKTESSTIDARKECISWDQLPRTFQDAVAMTRALDVRYLWIDSLCIVQDDAKDWQRESAKMHLTYRGAYLTLAASSSAGPGGGLFRDVPSEYSLRDWDLNGQRIRTRRKIPHIDSACDYPLMRRGWVFQERVLSRRVLHFSTAELAWECMEDNACECGQFYQHLGVTDSLLAPKERYRPIDEPKGWLMFVWRKIVMDYSRMELSYEKDVFPALSGVAELQRAVRGSTYLAGLWSDTLIYDLLWRVPKIWSLPVHEFQYDRVARPLGWRAPTWSWASVKSAVEYEEMAGFSSKLTRCEANVEHTGESETGELESATLEVSGMLVEVTIHRARINEERHRHRTAYLKFGDLGSILKKITIFGGDQVLWSKETFYLAYSSGSGPGRGPTETDMTSCDEAVGGRSIWPTAGSDGGTS